MTKPLDGSHRGPFWSVFEHSHIPMALVDRDRRFVAVNDAAVELYQYRREEVIGTPAGAGAGGAASAVGIEEWEQLLGTDELYGERVVDHPSGALRVSFAAHATTVDGQWLALFVTLSAQLEPGGPQLIKASAPRRDAPSSRGAAGSLTPREAEVVRRVALGRSTPQIAADLGLSPATVRSHVRNALVKTGAHTRAQLVALVLGEGLSDG